MKIVFVNDTVYEYASGAPAVGGAERQQWLLARALAASGWSVAVGVRDPLDHGRRQTIDGVEFVGIGRGAVHPSWYRFLADQRPDWWYWRCASHVWGIGVEIARLARVRTAFAAGFDTDVQPKRALVRRPRWWPLYAWGLSRTDRILVQHTGQLSALNPRWRSKASIVPSIVGQLDDMKPHAERSGYVAWVGMLRKPKRPDLLIDIARRLPDTRFVVCGGPTSFATPAAYTEEVIQALRSQPNIEYLGQTSPQTARATIANAAVLLSTSDGEGFPNTFLESWASGTPVISLNIDPGGVIVGRRLGLVPGVVERAVADVSALVHSPSQREEFGRRGRQYVAETHSEAAVAAIFERAIS